MIGWLAQMVAVLLGPSLTHQESIKKWEFWLNLPHLSRAKISFRIFLQTFSSNESLRVSWATEWFSNCHGTQDCCNENLVPNFLAERMPHSSQICSMKRLSLGCVSSILPFYGISASTRSISYWKPKEMQLRYFSTIFVIQRRTVLWQHAWLSERWKIGAALLNLYAWMVRWWGIVKKMVFYIYFKCVIELPWSFANLTLIMLNLTEGQRWRALGMIPAWLECGTPFWCTISRLWTKLIETDSVRDRPWPGRPRVTTRQQDRAIHLHHLRDWFLPASASAPMEDGIHGHIFSLWTIQRCFQESVLTCWYPF